MGKKRVSYLIAAYLGYKVFGPLALKAKMHPATFYKSIPPSEEWAGHTKAVNAKTSGAKPIDGFFAFSACILQPLGR